ncbi:hypothetical protein ES705_12420 [subsurface metagenome]
MPVSKNIIISVFIFITLAGCIEPFTPLIDESEESLVIEGQITDQAGNHYIHISRTAPYNDPHKIPEPDCQVEVVDNYGNIFEFYESDSGVYMQWIPKDFLNIGTQYKVKVITADGNIYESDFDELLSPSPPFGSIYYEIEVRETFDPDNPIYGIQFYIDLDAPDDFARNYRWELEETWEYEAGYRIQYYYDGTIHEIDDPFFLFRCWSTEPIRKIYTSTTRYSTSNTINKFPLHYVSNKSNRLKIKYSLLVKQYSLSNTAYDYWFQLQKQSQESGGLYETQPARIRGNISNVNDPEEVVLGFFNASSVTQKRIFVSEPFNFRIFSANCYLEIINRTSQLRKYTLYPVYLISLSSMGVGLPYGVGFGTCFDCRKGGGKTEKPYFWE